MKPTTTALTLLLFLAVLFTTSCQKSDVNPDYRKSFAGQYDVEEFSHALAATSKFRMTVRKKSESDIEVWLDNFSNTGLSVSAIITGYKIVIPQQVVSIYTVEGTGALNDNVLDLAYDISNNTNNFTDALNAKCIRR